MDVLKLHQQLVFPKDLTIINLLVDLMLFCSFYRDIS